MYIDSQKSIAPLDYIGFVWVRNTYEQKKIA